MDGARNTFHRVHDGDVSLSSEKGIVASQETVHERERSTRDSVSPRCKVKTRIQGVYFKWGDSKITSSVECRSVIRDMYSAWDQSDTDAVNTPNDWPRSTVSPVQLTVSRTGKLHKPSRSSEATQLNMCGCTQLPLRQRKQFHGQRRLQFGSPALAHCNQVATPRRPNLFI